MDVLQAIRYVIQGWANVTPATIRNCWVHTKILPPDATADLRNHKDDTCETAAPISDDLHEVIESLRLPDPIPIEEYLDFPGEGMVNEALDDDQVIEHIVELFQNQGEENIDEDEDDDSVEPPII